ncbi:MAG: carboxylating nicotinate-nucleotide diphosphorylase [Methylococcales bacterium]
MTDIRYYLDEDIGSGDLTASIIPESSKAKAAVVTRDPLVVCGQAWFDAVFKAIDSNVQIDWQVAEAEFNRANTLLCTVHGFSRSLLTGERTALNLLQTLSATATLSYEFAKAVEGTGCRVLDTRKTIPGLRNAQKYAVKCGGCFNHRIGLFDGILIKENHILAAGSIANAVENAKALKAGVVIEVEVESLDEVQLALDAGADRLLLDNFTVEALSKAVLLNDGRADLEASGNITLGSIRRVAETGVDYISIGALTKNVNAIDLSMRIEFLDE